MNTRIALVVGAVVIALAFGLGRVTASPAPTEPTEPSPPEPPTVAVGPRVDPRPALRVISKAREEDFFFYRYTGVSYGDGFSDACAGFGATEEACDRAYQRAHNLCSPDPDICFRPTSGYFTTVGYIKAGLKGRLEKWIYSRVEEELCAQIPEPDERLAKWCS